MEDNDVQMVYDMNGYFYKFVDFIGFPNFVGESTVFISGISFNQTFIYLCHDDTRTMLIQTKDFKNHSLLRFWRKDKPIGIAFNEDKFYIIYKKYIEINILNDNKLKIFKIKKPYTSGFGSTSNNKQIFIYDKIVKYFYPDELLFDTIVKLYNSDSILFREPIFRVVNINRQIQRFGAFNVIFGHKLYIILVNNKGLYLINKNPIQQ